MPALSAYAQKRKIDFFLKSIGDQDSVLEVGCGSGWVGEYFSEQGFKNYQGVDLVPPADLVGDICNWQELGLQAESCDWIIAFEVVEHVDIYPACEALLKPGGKLLVTTPLPHADWIMRSLEIVGLNQKRTSLHSNLHYLKTTGRLKLDTCRWIAGLAQWGIFEKQSGND